MTFDVNYQGHVTSVDLRKIVAISKPINGDRYFKVFFDNAIWTVSPEQYAALHHAWSLVKDYDIICESR